MATQISESVATQLLNITAVNQVTKSIFYIVTEYEAVGDGASDDYSPLSALISRVGSDKVTFCFPPGEYVIGTNLTFPANITLLFLNGGKIKESTGITVTINGNIEVLGNSQAFSGSGTITLTNISTIYPEWFGAVRNGTTDDITAIQRAYGAVPSGKRAKIAFKAGIYGTGGAIVPPNYVKFVGAGKDQTVLKSLSTYPVIPFDPPWGGPPILDNQCTFTIKRNNANHITIMDMTLDFNGFGVGGVDTGGSSYTGMNNIKIQNVRFTNNKSAGSTKEGIDAVNVNYLDIIDCDFDDLYQDVYLSDIENLQFHRNDLDGSSWSGMTMRDSNHCKLSLNSFTNNDGFGIEISGTIPAVGLCGYDIEFVNNYVAYNGKVGDIYSGLGLFNCTKVLVSGNLFEFNVYAGSHNYGDYYKILDNFYVKNGVSGAFSISSWATGCEFKGNYLISNNTRNTSDTAASGFFVATGNWVVEGNYAYNETGVGYQRYGIEISNTSSLHPVSCKNNQVVHGGVSGNISLEGFIAMEERVNILNYINSPNDGDVSSSLDDLQNCDGLGTLYFPSGVYPIETNLTLNCDVHFDSNVTLNISSGVTFIINGKVTGGIPSNGGTGTLKTSPISNGFYSTAQRNGTSCVFPATSLGTMVYDSTLGKPVWLKTTAPVWVDATGSTV